MNRSNEPAKLVARRTELADRHSKLIRKRPLIADKSAVLNGMELVKLGMAEVRRASPKAFGDPDRFDTLAEQVRAIVDAEAGGPVDPRLVRAAAGANETDPSAGGFLLQINFSQDLATLAYEQSFIAALCDRREMSKPLTNVKVPGIDEASRAEGARYGGVVSYWANEAAAVSGSLPKFRNVDLITKKLIALVYGTDELLSDAPMWEAHVKRAVSAEFAFKLDLTALLGTGAGQPQGIVGSSALITVPKETGQVAGTIIRENINKMWKRLPAPSRHRAVWFTNEDADEQFDALSGTPGVYVPAGVAGNEFPLLKGRPVIAIEQCPVLGTVGDLVLADLDHYIMVDGGLNSAISLHVRFDSDQVLLRFTMRVDGKPSFVTPVAPFNGSGLTRSPFVALGPR